MKFKDQATKILKDLRENPTDPARIRDAGVLYWTVLEEEVVGYVHEKMDLKAFLSEESDFVNYGITAEMLDNAPEISTALRDGAAPIAHVKVCTVTDWLLDAFSKTLSGDKKEALEKEIRQTEVYIKRLENEISGLEQQRKKTILGGFYKDAVPTPLPPALQADFEKMHLADKLHRENLRTKKTISKGIFLSVKDKRLYCEQEKQHAEILEQIEAFLATIDSRETIAAVKHNTGQINDNFAKIIDGEDAIARMRREVSEVAKKQREISPLEIEAVLRKEMEYLRDLAKLSAKRLHNESGAILRPEDKYFTFKELTACIDRVVEFDPALFDNTRVSIFGLPSVLVVPCNGNALFDWKNNMIIVPLVPPAGNFMASIAFGMIEYRLDVDDEKHLLTSYSELPQHKDVKSIFSLKNDLTKDYMTWMTSEYKGYKTLPKEIRKWFEHEVAPNKNEIAVPLEFRPFLLCGEAFVKKCKDIDALLKEDLGSCPESALWEGSIVSYQQGKFDRCLELLKALIAKNHGHAAALYNAGQACMKLMRKQEAVDYFNEYYKRNPQSWWASVATEHIRRLQTGHAS
jgi:tetratricopeptide (TPR) repeat protein